MRAPLPPCAEAPAPAEVGAPHDRGEITVAVCSPPASPSKQGASALKLHLPRAETGAAARLRGLLCFVAVTVLTASYSLLVEASKTSTGRFAYSPLAVTFTAESSKLAVSLLMLRGAAAPQPSLRAADLARAAVPALLYCVQNNAAFAALRFLTPPLYQLLSNLKIVATAVLSCVVLNRVFSRLQVEHVSGGLAACDGLADALRARSGSAWRCWRSRRRSQASPCACPPPTPPQAAPA
jgi:hypothetical protein